MSSNQRLSNWYDAYIKVAEVLHKFYIENKENPARELYERLKGTGFSELNEGRLFRERLSRISEWGLDPLQIFAIFNYPKIGDRRIKIINSLLKEFESDKRVDESISFDGCPSPIITQVVQYRGWKVQNEIWEMFGEVIEKGIRGLRERHFLSIKGWRGIDIASFTMFLYWINSDEFLPMDRNTVDFLKSFDIIAGRPRSYKEYYDLCSNKLRFEEINYNNTSIFRNIVRDAYFYSKKEYNGPILSGSTISIISKIEKNSFTEDLETVAKRKQKERVKAFRIIALRPRKKFEEVDTKQKHLKNLIEGELYQFYHFYHFSKNNDDIIRYNANDDIDLYSLGDLNISISAIVGKNGSGKSTIAEFLYLVINKIAFAKNIKSTERLIDEEVFADVFIRLDKLYKISVGKHVEIFEYELVGDVYKISTKENRGKAVFRKFDIESFFYSVVVNYSLYALNTNIVGDWIYPLFHKNDSYQTPIVLNPLRNNGNVDVNNEESLAKSRMLSNILEPNLIDFEQESVPELVPGSSPSKLILEFDQKKIDGKKAKYKALYKRLYKKHIDKVIEALGFDINLEVTFLHQAKEYLYLKIVDIANKYPKFKEFENLPSWVSDDDDLLKLYIKKLLEETSHITFKLKQVINYLKFGIYKTDKDYEILFLSSKIGELKDVIGVRTIELTPPPFFKTNIVFDHGGTFDDLSSGEKQQVFSINTIAYHLYNIASVMLEADTFKYYNINIVFDEVELYFHPEMQRTYINNLLHRISTLQLDDQIHNVNIQFITHSPFILSDIPSSNILRLDINSETLKSFPVGNGDQTFGANIHDLLANDFFLENGFMGEFSKNKINKIIQFLNVSKLLFKLKLLNQKEVSSEQENDTLKEQKENLESQIIYFLPKLSHKYKEDGKSTHKNRLRLLTEEVDELIVEKFLVSPSDCISIINLIGEPILKQKLFAMYNETFPTSDKERKEQQFLELAKQLNYKVIKE